MKTSLVFAMLAGMVTIPAHAQMLSPAGEVKSPSNMFFVVLSPTGQEIAASCAGNKLRTFSTTDGKLHLTIDGGSINMTVPAYSGDSKRIAVASAEGEVRVFDSATGATIRSLSPSLTETYVIVIALSTDGRVLAVAPAEKPVQLWDVDHNKLIASLENPFSGSSALAFSPNGRLLASADNDGVVRVYDAATGRIRSRYDALLMETFSIAFSRDSRQLAVGGADRAVVVIDPLTGNELRRLPTQKDPIGNVAILPDGKTVVASMFNVDHMSEAKNTVAWDLSSGKSTTVASGKNFISGAALPDGRLMLASVDGNIVKLWSIR